MSVLSKTGRYGILAGFLYNTFIAADGEGGLSVEGLSGLLEGLGWDTKWLEDSTVAGLAKGREGPLSLLAASLFAEGDLRKWGIWGAFGWLGLQLIQQYQKDGLKNEMNTVSGFLSNPDAEKDANASNEQKQTKVVEAVSANITITPQAIERARSLADEHSSASGDGTGLDTSGTVSKILADANAGKHSEEVAAYDAATRGLDALKEAVGVNDVRTRAIRRAKGVQSSDAPFIGQDGEKAFDEAPDMEVALNADDLEIEPEPTNEG